MTHTARQEVELLILGAGWTRRDGTIEFKFDPESDDLGPYTALPRARTVLITFPLKGSGQSSKLWTMYWNTHDRIEVNWILLGSTGIFDGNGWSDHNSSYNKTLPRAVAEDELIAKGGTVLSLAGLYGDTTRIPRTWVSRVVKDKDQLMTKRSLHLIHGEDVARAILATHKRIAVGERWIVTDRHVYDWWDLIDGWGDELESEWVGEGERPQYRQWVAECMAEANERALPRGPQSLGRLLDSRDFWKTMKILPGKKLQR